MRNITLIVTGILLLGAALLSWWPTRTNSVAATIPSPPGQYPLDATRYEWVAQARTAAYRPSTIAGSNDAGIAGTKDAKAICALSPSCPQ